ncbi:MAG: hypothetical protein AAFU78_21740, partial [Cyanobacteria bacterium J06633_2]
MIIVFLSDGWGAKHGGINALSTDLSIAVADELGDAGKVFAIARRPLAEETSNALKKNVRLISLDKPHGIDNFDVSWVHDIHRAVNECGCSSVDHWVGHDIKSGWAALEGAKSYGGSAALIHHMSYERYQPFKSDDPSNTDDKIQDQRELFAHDATLFGVGPLLRSSCAEISGRHVNLIVPGFAEGSSNTSSNDRISAIVVGRLDGRNDRIKQGQLAVASFGNAIGQARSAGLLPSSLREPSLTILGVCEKETAEITRLAEERLGGALSILPLPFDPDRDALLQRLSRSNLAMMLSWHEGFGLT